MVLEADPLDKTRDREKYVPTWNYLKEVGIDVIKFLRLNISITEPSSIQGSLNSNKKTPQKPLV